MEAPQTGTTTMPMDKSNILEACKAELEATGQLEALRCIQSLESRIQGSSEAIVPSRKKVASVIACTLCRKSKAKCVISHPGASQCNRCQQAGCVCVFEKHKRGRKPTRGFDMPRAELMQLEGESFPVLQFPLPRDTIHRPRSLPASTDDEASTSALQSQPPLHSRVMVTSDDDIDVVQPPITHAAAHPLPFISGSHRPFTIQSILNPLSPAHDDRDFEISTSFDLTDQPSGTATSLGDLGDPISRHLVSLEIAQQLYAFFFEKLNQIVMLFDPAMHTFEYVRHKSSFLFSAILSSSAKFVAPNLYKKLSQMTMDYSLRAILVRGRSVETIQGWMIIYFWKAPRDNRAWMYVGLACRMGVELGLDCTPIQDSHDASELSQRERRNRQRTWMLAFMMDRAMASATGRDWMVRGRDAVIRGHRIFSDHPCRQPGDAVVGGFTELRLISSEAVDLLYPGVASTSPQTGIDVTRELLRVNYDLKLWLQYWTRETERFSQPPIYLALLRLFGLHVQLTLNSFAIPHANNISPSLCALPGTETQTPERYCYDLAVQNLTQLHIIHGIDESILRYMQDSISIMVAYAACFLWKVINNSQFHDNERQSAVLLIAKTSEMFRQVTIGPLDTATLQAQFLRSLVEHSQSTCFRPPPHTQHNTNINRGRGHPDIQDPASFSSGSLIQYPANSENSTDDVTTLSYPTTKIDVDVPILDGVTWDEIMADWMANPDSNSLQYKDFVTNFATSSFVDVLQHHLTEYPDQFTYGT